MRCSSKLREGNCSSQSEILLLSGTGNHAIQMQSYRRWSSEVASGSLMWVWGQEVSKKQSTYQDKLSQVCKTKQGKGRARDASRSQSGVSFKTQQRERGRHQLCKVRDLGWSPGRQMQIQQGNLLVICNRDGSQGRLVPFCFTGTFPTAHSFSLWNGDYSQKSGMKYKAVHWLSLISS